MQLVIFAGNSTQLKNGFVPTMINTILGVTFKTVNEALDREGNPVVYGELTFSTYGDDSNTIPYRGRGKVAEVLKHNSVGLSGMAQGYIDIHLESRGNYQEKLPTMVIRNLVAANTEVQTPDFAKELLEQSIASTQTQTQGVEIQGSYTANDYDPDSDIPF